MHTYAESYIKRREEEMGGRMRGGVAPPYQSQYHKEHNHETIKSSKSIRRYLPPWFSLWPSRAKSQSDSERKAFTKIL